MGRPGVRWPNGSMSKMLQPPQSEPHPQEQENMRSNQAPHQSPTTNPNISPAQRQNNGCSASTNPDISPSQRQNNDNILSQSRPKRKRGPAFPYADWGTGKKLIVTLNRFSQPIGPTAPKLASQLGIIARNGTFCPITYTSWTCKELDEFKKRIWEDVKNNCEVSDDYKENCLMSIGKKWRAWKMELRDKYYHAYDNDEDRLKIVDNRVDPDQWKLFVEYTSSEMAMDRSKINRENQKKKVMSHTSGRKAHACVRDEMTIDGIEPDRLDMFVETHTKKKSGVPVDKASAEAMAAVKGQLHDIPETEQTPEFREKVFTDVFGRDTHGRVRTFGLGPCPTKVFGKKDSVSHQQYSRDMETFRNNVREEIREEIHKEFVDKFNLLEQKYARLEAKFQRMCNPSTRFADRQSVHEEVSDAHSSHRQSKDPQHYLFEVPPAHNARHPAKNPQDHPLKVQEAQSTRNPAKNLQDHPLEVSDAHSSHRQCKDPQPSPLEVPPAQNARHPAKKLQERPLGVPVHAQSARGQAKKLLDRPLEVPNAHNVRHQTQNVQDRQLKVPNTQSARHPVKNSHHPPKDQEAQSVRNPAKNMQDNSLEVGMVVRLFHHTDPRKVVAIGVIVSKNASKETGGQPLGDGFWEVRIEKALIPGETLLICPKNVHTIRQAVNKTVFWRRTDIKKMKMEQN